MLWEQQDQPAYIHFPQILTETELLPYIIKEHKFYVLAPYTRQNTVQSGQDDLVNLFQNQEPHQLNPLDPQLPQASEIQQLNPSETATIQNPSEFSEETVQTVQNTQSLTITNGFKSYTSSYPQYHTRPN